MSRPNPARVKIYTTPTSIYSRMAKEFFQDNNIPFLELDVSEDAKARNEMVELTGQFGVPVIVIDGEILYGFDKEKLSQLLGL